jgi:hypothetical protein
VAILLTLNAVSAESATAPMRRAGEHQCRSSYLRQTAEARDSDGS